MSEKPTYEELERRLQSLEAAEFKLKKAEEALRRSEERYRLLADHSLDVIWTMNTDLEFTYVNPSVRALTGYTTDEWVGSRLSDHCDDDNFAKMVEVIADEMAKGPEGPGVIFEAEVLKKNQESLPVEIHGKLIYDDSGQLTGLQGTTRDISKRKRAEEENARIEDQFRQAQKVEAIGRLAGGVAHDLNNLLSPILGFAELLMIDLSPHDKRHKYANQIVRAGYRARDLVRQLLAFGRRQTLEYKTINLNHTIEGFESLLRRTIREDIELEIITSMNIHSIKADIGQIEQVIMNLAVNAQDAMPEGGKLIFKTAMAELDQEFATEHPGAQAGRYVLLTISDTGCGMDEETQKHIFEPFFSTKGAQGTGLGLATVYGIVKQHKGNVWVDSQPGKGSTFKVYLPASEETKIEEETSQDNHSALKGSETILLVEDSEQVRDLSHTILKRQGYTLLVAENGAEALRILAAHDGPLDLLLTDVVMPDMNGRDLFTRVAEKCPGIRVLYMSGYTDNVIAHHGVLDRGVEFIQKPFSVQALATKVRKVLEKPEES